MKEMPLIEFHSLLKNSESIEALNHALEIYLSSFNITMFAFTYYSYYPNSLNKLKFDYASKKYKIWHQHYIDEGYEDTDSTLDVVYQTTLPIFWNIQSQLDEAKTPREKKMRKDALQFGCEKGLSIPVHGPQEDFAILVLIQMQGQHCLDDVSKLQFEFLSAAYYYYQHLHHLLILKQPDSSDILTRLSAREIQCLTLLAKQYSLEAIANSLNITQRTVNYHIQRLNKKLGTQNKYQSVIKAIKKGLINL